MVPLLVLLLGANLHAPAEAPAGTALHIRLTTAVGSYASRPGSAVHAVLIAPLTFDGREVLPAGSTVDGKIASVRRVGLGVLHETASLDLDFSRATPPDGAPLAISTRLLRVDNSRERVAADGRIEGVRTTSSLSYRVSGYVQMLVGLDLHAEAAEWLIKALVIQLPEPEIYYPAGTELTLTLTKPFLGTALPASGRAPRRLSDQERASLAPLLAGLPVQTTTPVTKRPSDLVNVLFVGSRRELADAFAAAGWTDAHPRTFRSGIKGIRAVAEEHGDGSAPMSSLLLDDAASDMAWEKGLNDVAKRHHVRIWKNQGTWEGREVWLGAATQDVDFAYLRPGRLLTHKISEKVDAERDKIGNDLAFAGCVDTMDWWDRPQVPHLTSNSTGDPMQTDGRLEILWLNNCRAAAEPATMADDAVLPAHGGPMQRLLRREIMSLRNDLIRDNVYWRSYEGVRYLAGRISQHRRANRHVQPPTVETDLRLHRSTGDLGFLSLH
jgi:LssY C-terminus